MSGWRESFSLSRLGTNRLAGESIEVSMLRLTTLLLLFAAPLTASAAPLYLEACDQELTELGKRSRFQGTLVYNVETDLEGQVSTARLVYGEKLTKFVDEPAIAQCVRAWLLEPDSSYKVTVEVGTTGTDRKVSAVEVSGLDISVRIPNRKRGLEQCRIALRARRPKEHRETTRQQLYQLLAGRHPLLCSAPDALRAHMRPMGTLSRAGPQP